MRKRETRIRKYLHKISVEGGSGGSWARRQAARRHNSRKKHNGKLGTYARG